MQCAKLISIFIILTAFAGFTCFEIHRKSEKYVLNVERADTIQVDLNGNKVIDSGETICIPQIQIFTSDLKIDQNKLATALFLSDKDAIKLGYLTDKFAQNLLEDKKLKVKFTGETNQNCKYADIIIDNESYRTKLLNSGLGFYAGKPLIKSAYNDQLNKAKKLNLICRKITIIIQIYK